MQKCIHSDIIYVLFFYDKFTSNYNNNIKYTSTSPYYQKDKEIHTGELAELLFWFRKGT